MGIISDFKGLNFSLWTVVTDSRSSMRVTFRSSAPVQERARDIRPDCQCSHLTSQDLLNGYSDIS